MTSHFSAEFFVNNRKKLLEIFRGSAPIVVTANGLLQRSGDTVFPFQQDSNFWYLSGINSPDVTLVMDKGREYLIVPFKSDVIQLFDGAIDKHELSRVSGIKEIYNQQEGWDKLKQRLKKVKHVATIAASEPYIEFYGFFTNPARGYLKAKLQAENPALKLLDLSEHLARLRTIKQPEEVNALKDAISITEKAIKSSTKKGQLAKYAYEYEIEANITKSIRSQGASGHAFDPVVASGKRACTIHSVDNNAKLGPNDLVVIDVGAQVENYSADISRTFALSSPSKRQRDVYGAVKETQNYAISLLKPNVNRKEYEEMVERYIGEKLRELGLIKTINQKNVRRYFPHLTSHFLGLNTHDIGEYNKPLQVGTVLTVEPGIYIKEEGIGVRIEDDLLITAKGNTVLSSNLPKEL